MTELRETRNREIIAWYWDLRERHYLPDEIVEIIYISEQNKKWCLGRDAIRLIGTDKKYGHRNKKTAPPVPGRH